MKVRAKHWMKHDGRWYRGGEKFEVSTIEADGLKGMIKIAETPVLAAEPEPFAEAFAPEPEEPVKRRSRRRKAEAEA